MNIQEQIRRRAYEIWQYRTEYQLNIIITKYGEYQNLTAQDDWLQAEDEILQSIRQGD